MFRAGDVISYLDMCTTEGAALQRGMNYHLHDGISVVLMSVRTGSPYADRVEADGTVLIYEGHDVPHRKGGPDPKTIDQPMRNPGGSLTQNGMFFEAAKKVQNGSGEPELVRVYEKIRNGVWVFNGVFRLVDAWPERINSREVFKFRLEIADGEIPENHEVPEIDHTRLIPAAVKLHVWRRDRGRCTKCGSQDNLHFDHILPYSKGGSSLVAENIQILCARHNLEKRDRIEWQ